MSITVSEQLDLNNIIRLAKNECRKTPNLLKFKIGCIIFDDNLKIYSSGHNYFAPNNYASSIHYLKNYKRHVPWSWPGLCGVHAEIDALAKLNFDQKILRNLNILNFGLSRAGNHIKSKPCKNCEDILRFMQLARVYYSEKHNGGFVIESFDLK